MGRSISMNGVVLLVVFHTVCLAAREPAGRCLVDREEVNPKRYLHYEGKSLNITLEVSNRITHQLATNVYKIVLQEVLGYPNVEIVQLEDNFNVKEIYERLSRIPGQPSQIPRIMVNTEVWVPPEESTEKFTERYLVHECGYVAQPGRFGWFIPASLPSTVKLLDKRWPPNSQDFQWIMFTDLQVASLFRVDDLQLLEENSLKNATTKEYFCMSKECKNGVYEPDYCQQKPCGFLLAPHYNDTSFVIHHIREMKVYVKVIWLGHNLKKVVRELTWRYSKKQSNRSLVILSWTPSDVIVPQDDFVSVAFKRCELLRSSDAAGCKYELNRLLKISWYNLEKLARPAYLALRKMFFSEENYSEMLLDYNQRSQHKGVYDVACNWLRKNTFWLTDFELSIQNFKEKIYIGGIFPITGSFYTAKGIALAARMAREAVNKNETLLRDYDLELLAHDGQCQADMVMKRFIDYIVENYYSNLVGVLGPACSDTVEPLAGVSKHYRTLVISYSAEGASFSDRSKYPYFFRTIGENKHYNHVYLKFLQQMRWKRVAALTEDGQKYTEYISHMQGLLEKQGITFIANTKFPRERDMHVLSGYLEDLKRKRARIIIADLYDEAARAVMCEAYKLSMTAKEGYVWFLPVWLSNTWYNTTYYNNMFNETVNCTTDMMLSAINGHLALTHAYFAPDNAIMQENITVGKWREIYENTSAAHSISTSAYAGYAYDAVWTFALAVDKLIKADPEALYDLHSPNTTMKLVDIVKATDFEGVSGRIKFRGGPSRFSVINILQWVDKERNIIGTFYPNISDDKPEITDGVLQLNESAFIWFSENGLKPDDGSEPPQKCVFSGLAELLDISCEAAIIVANVIGFSFLGAILVIAFFIVKRRYDKKVQLTQKYMKSLGIDLLSPSSVIGLDKWEIPRDRVVINRKLGEGAFGTVYGGEAYFNEKGWVAVAVKTLKVGSTTEEKLDFISEAEVMKRFEHKNIITLLGVCTKNEPVYTIMEFMLYGDLKTFLLARRHLVNERVSEECEEISSKKLTNMALDVARALGYLAELKYVHRDVASRNCLVNSQRVVKLSDFGMTRPTFENDYYKFNRKGMLPVRWMAPESLGLGLFTPSSDVWSYGVLLYEIITFGSFPFQGLSNNQVLEHVKAGNTITIPHGVKPQLESLIRSCWNHDSKKRPQASEIVEFLANNPRLIAPCLDVPLASVQMENTGQLELHLPEKRHKFSLTVSANQDHFVPNGVLIDTRPVPRNNASNTLDSGFSGSIHSDNCVHEPLLGARELNSPANLTKYVKLQHVRTDSGCNSDDYSSHELNPVTAVSIL